MFLFSLDKYSGVELLDHMVIFNFLRNVCNFSIVAAPAYIPTNSAQGLPFAPCPHQVLFLVFLTIAVLTGEVVSDCDFDLHFSNN